MATGAQGFAEAVRNLFLGVVAQVGGGAAGPGGGQEARPEEAAKVVLECVFAAGVDVSTVLPQQRCVVLGGGSQSWAVGRQEQIELFARLIPDEAKRTQISRTHLEISLAGPGGAAQLTRLSQSALLLNGAPVPHRQPVPLPHGSQLGFCGPDVSAPFLVFRAFVDDRSAQPPARPPAVAAAPLAGGAAQAPTVAPLLPPVPAQPRPPSPPPAASPVAPSGFYLECVYANACDVALLPPESRRIALPSDAALRVGRQHQVGFFEGLLHKDENFLSFISRSHLELTPVAGDPSGAFTISNLSANPVGVGPQQLGKGQSAVIQVPAHVLFLCGLNPGAPTCFLRLSLERHGGGGAPAAPMPGTTPILPPPAAGPAPGARPPSAAAAPTEDVIRPSAASPEVPGRAAAAALHHAAAAPAATVYTPPSSARAARAPPWLEVGGTAVRADFPAALRAVAVGEGVTVGRTHQAQIFREAIAEEVLQFTSRDHFRVDPGPGPGGFSLVALSSNPLWLVRAGQRWEARRHEPLPLADGDMVQLYTGDAAQHNFYWIFHQATAAGAVANDTPTVSRQPAPGAQGGTLPASCLYAAPAGMQQPSVDYSLTEVPRQAPPSYGTAVPAACQGTTILHEGGKPSSSATYYEKAITG